MREVAELVARVGFPAVVALYVLIRMDGALRENTAAIHALRVLIARALNVE